MRIIKEIFLLVLLGVIGCADSPSIDVNSDQDDLETLLVIETELTETRFALKKAMESESAFSDIMKKNLFNSERTFIETYQNDDAVPEPTPPLQRSAIDLPSLELIGTLITTDEANYAFIKNLSEKDANKRNKVFKYEIGQWIGDYILSKIESNKVTLLKGDEVAVLKLKASSNNQPRQPRGRSARGSESIPPRTRQSTNDNSREQQRKKEEVAKEEISSSRFQTKQQQDTFSADSSSWENELAKRHAACGASTKGSMRDPCGR